MLEQRAPQLSQVESHKHDSSDVPVKRNRREIGVANGLVHHAQSLDPKSGIQVSAFFSAEVCSRRIMLKLHAVTNRIRNILHQFW